MMIIESALHTAMNFWNDVSVREDHYNGRNSLYRLSAKVPLEPALTTEYLLNNSHYLRGLLSELPIRPSRIFIYDDMYEIEWFAKCYLVVSSKAQYMELILHFAQYLDENQFEHFRMDIQEGFVGDDPGSSIDGIPFYKINFSPKFINECFGNNGEIEVFCAR